LPPISSFFNSIAFARPVATPYPDGLRPTPTIMEARALAPECGVSRRSSDISIHLVTGRAIKLNGSKTRSRYPARMPTTPSTGSDDCQRQYRQRRCGLARLDHRRADRVLYRLAVMCHTGAAQYDRLGTGTHAGLRRVDQPGARC
jgi:hypothetical protein